MTLLLGALNTNVIVFGADGAEFRHAPNRPKYLDLLNRRKILPISGRPMVAGIHGQNRLTSNGFPLDAQWLVIETLPRMAEEIGGHITVEGFCRELARRLTPDVKHTFQLLADAGIQTAPMGLVVGGFDDSLPRPKCFEAWWPLVGSAEPSITEHPRDKRIPAVMHSGDGAQYAKTAISHGSRYSVDRLKKADLTKTQDYVRVLYRKAASLQPTGAIEFAGEYHEVSVTPEGASWTVAESPNQRMHGSGG